MLSEVPHELSTDAHSKECKRSPQQFIPAGFPLHNQLPTGTEDSASPLTTPDMVRSGRVLQPQLNLHSFDVPSPLGYNKIKFIQNAQASLPAPSPHRTWSVPDASSQPQLNLYISLPRSGKTAGEMIQ